MNLSERQERILAFIRQYGDEHGFPPTIREIGKAVGITSTSVVKYNLERLEEKGKLERSDEISRGLRLKEDAAGGPAARPAPPCCADPQAGRDLGRRADPGRGPAGEPLQRRCARP